MFINKFYTLSLKAFEKVLRSVVDKSVGIIFLIKTDKISAKNYYILYVSNWSQYQIIFKIFQLLWIIFFPPYIFFYCIAIWQSCKSYINLDLNCKQENWNSSGNHLSRSSAKVTLIIQFSREIHIKILFESQCWGTKEDQKNFQLRAYKNCNFIFTWSDASSFMSKLIILLALECYPFRRC